MVKKINVAIAVAAIIAMAGSASCKKQMDKDSTPDADAKVALSAMSNKFRFVDWPAVSNGTLVFRDADHCENYIRFLESAIDPQNYDSVRLDKNGAVLEFDQDAILEDIENGLGFVSVRKLSHDMFLSLNEEGWSRLQDIPEEHFIHDPVIKSLLNENLYVQVGDKYIRYINKNLQVAVQQGAGPVWVAYRQLPVTTTLSEALLIDPTRKVSTLRETDGNGNLSVFGGTPGSGVPLGDGEVTIVGLKTGIEDCNIPLKIAFSEMRMYQSGPWTSTNQGYLHGFFKVDFGDGMVDTFYTITNQIGVAVCETFEHTYAAPGNYNYKIWGYPSSVLAGYTANNAYLNEHKEVTDRVCVKTKKDGEIEYRMSGDGSRAVSGKIEVNYVSPYFGSDKTQILSETASWFWNGSKWKASKAEIWGNLHTERMDATCNVLGPVDGDAWASSSKKIIVHRRDPIYYWNTVTSQHGIKHNSVWYYLSKSLLSCQ